MKPVRVGISGAGGRMGRELLGEVLRDSDVVLAAAIEHAGHPLLVAKAAILGGEVSSKNNTVLTDSFNPSDVDVFIDFSTPSAAVELSRQCRKHKIPMIIGVTGFSKAEEKELHAAADDIPLLVSPNMSLGVLVMYKIVRQAAALLKHNHDAEICETHHRNKKDAPSGTALRLGEIIAEEFGEDFTDVAVFNRQRKNNTRGKKEIGFSAIRGGDIIGEHKVIFAGLGEQLEITHRCSDRLQYAVGAIFAAGRLVGKPPKLYSMEDVAVDGFEKVAKG